MKPVARLLPLALALTTACGAHPETLDVQLRDATDADSSPEAGGDNAWIRGASMYRVSTRSFAATDGASTGNFPGLVQHMSQADSLSINALVLLPVTPATRNDNAGIAPTDLFSTDPAYGSADGTGLVEAISVAHSHGHRVVLDLPLDAASSQHPFFLDAISARTAMHHGDFVWIDAPCPAVLAPDGTPAWHLVASIGQCFWSKYGADAPEWNYDSPGVRSMATDAIHHWIDAGADGIEIEGGAWLDDSSTSGPARFGSDATHARLREIVLGTHALQTLLGSTAIALVQGGSDPASFAADGLDAVRDDEAFQPAFDAALRAQGVEPLAAVFDQASALATPLTFSPGDERSPAEGRSADALAHDLDVLNLGALTLLAAPGDPMLYYGDEIGLGTGAPDANGVRSRLDPMAWDGTDGRGFTTGTPWTPFYEDRSVNVAAQNGSGGSLLETYRTLLSVRFHSPALRHGTYTRVHSGSDNVLAFLRVLDGERALVVINFDHVTHLPALDLASVGITSATVRDMRFTFLEPPVTPGNAASYGRTLPARTGRWLHLE